MYIIQKFNGDIQIIRYSSKKDIDVKFLQTGYIKTTDANQYKTRYVKRPTVSQSI